MTYKGIETRIANLTAKQEKLRKEIELIDQEKQICTQLLEGMNLLKAKK